MGEIAPYHVQHLLDRACWDADLARDRVRKYALEQLSASDAVLIVDETGFMKKRVHSVGVKRQYTGTAGRIENSQVGVFLCYASSRGAALIDRELYLPEEWAPGHAYYWFHAPETKSSLETLVRVAGQRWQIEQVFQVSKGECGPDHYEVRSWHGGYRHITLAMLAHAAFVVLRSRGEKSSSRAGLAHRSRTTPSSRSVAMVRMARR